LLTSRRKTCQDICRDEKKFSLLFFLAKNFEKEYEIAFPMARNFFLLRFAGTARENLFFIWLAERWLPRAHCENTDRQEFADNFFRGFS
jgi:hypothetical protein